MTPDDFTIKEFHLDVGDGHSLYVHDWGNKSSNKPVMFLHGGPGDQVKDKYKLTFDPVQQRVIFFDQRGCGQSHPAPSLKDNTTDKLVGDINKILDHLKIKKAILTGGSWGACLALVYAINNPERVSSMVLNGIFTGSKSDADWIDKGKFRSIFPDVWDTYVETVPDEFKDDPSAYHFDKALHGTAAEQKKSIYAYSHMAVGAISLDDRHVPENFEDFEPNESQIEITYLANGCFIPDNFVMDNAHKITMPVFIVQGRYDLMCPPEIAYNLHKKLPNSHLTWTISGHVPEHESIVVMRTILLQLTTD